MNKSILAASICAALAAGQSQAATFNVTNNADAGPGSLRQALIDANANAEADVIELSSISGQTIALSSGALYSSYDDITINGADVTVDAGGNSRVLEAAYADFTLNDLTITGGDSSAGQGIGPGGGIFGTSGDLTLNNTTVTGNTAGAPGGGGIAVIGYDSSVSINDSVISGNIGGVSGGGLFVYSYYGNVSISGSTISGNSLEGGGLQPPRGPDNTGRDLAQRLAARLNDPVRRPAALRGEPGAYSQGGGGFVNVGFGNIEVTDSTISGNQAFAGAGLIAISSYSSVSVARTTFSANQADQFGGAGVLQGKYAVSLSNSTISGNSSGGLGGGVLLYSSAPGPVRGDGTNGVPSSVTIEFTTVTGNTAVDIGGIGVSGYVSATIAASVISGNTATTDPDIGFEPGSTAAADVSVSLIGVDSSSGTLTFDAASAALLGQDPLLGPLADNGGPTFTHLPAAGSPLIDAVAAGEFGCGTTFDVDQRGEPRPQGAGCEIGALENLAGVPPLPEILPVPTLDRLGLWLMTGLLGLAGWFGVRRRASRNV